MSPRRSVALAASFAAVIALAGCSNEEAKPSGTSAAPQDTVTQLAPSGSQCYGLTVTDAWAKAPQTGAKMTGVFGSLKNEGTTPVHITGGTSARANKVELHEVVAKGGKNVMQPKAGGFTIAPGATLTLAPGKDHVMLMDLNSEVVAGENALVVLECEDGSKVPVQAEARTFSGGNENYGGSTGMPSASSTAEAPTMSGGPQPTSTSIPKATDATRSAAPEQAPAH